MPKFVNKPQDFLSVTVLEVIEETTAKRTEMCYVFHVRILKKLFFEKPIQIKFFYLYLLFVADNFRPYLTSFQGNAFTDYINAVFVDVSIDNHFFLKNYKMKSK